MVKIQIIHISLCVKQGKRTNHKIFEYLRKLEVLEKKSSITTSVCPVLKTVPAYRQALSKNE